MHSFPRIRFRTRRQLVALAGLGSLGLILGAWFFEIVVGLAPCAMCYWQRWPHYAAIAIAALGLARLPRIAGAAIGWAGATAVSVSGAIAIYHSGVERGWWLGPASCTSRGQSLEGLSGADLLDPSAAAPIVLCDEIPWELFGLSMANYNILISFGLAGIWLFSTLKSDRGTAV